MTLSIDGGGASGGNLPDFKNAAIQGARELAGRAGLTTLLDRATLMLNKPGEISYQDNRFGDGAESAVQNAALLGKVTRTGSALIPNWNFRSGGKVGPLRVAADNKLRWNEPPEDEYAGHPLIETAGATNLIQNPLGEGAGIGDVSGAGSMPTHWSVWIDGGGLTTSIIAITTRDGWPIVRVRASGTSTGGTYALRLGPSTGHAAAVSGETLALSTCFALYAGAITNINSFGIRTYENSSGGTALDAGGMTDIKSLIDDELRRFEQVEPFGNGSTAYAMPVVYMSVAAGAVDITFDIGLPMLEKSSAVTSPCHPGFGNTAESSRGAETRNGGFQCVRDGRAIGFEWDGTNGGVISPAREYYKHSPVSEGCIAKGMPATTNKIRNPNFIGGTAGVMGSGGVAPTNMTLGTHAGSEIVGFGQEGIARYIDVRINGTPTTNIYLAFEPGTQVALVDGDDATQSTGVRLVNGSFAAFSAIRTYIQTRTGAGAAVGSVCTNDFTPDYRSRYFTQSEAVSGGTIAYGQPYLVFYNPDGVTACDFTIRIYLPMMEKTLLASMPIIPPPGETGEASRVRTDVSNVPTDYIGADSFTVFGEVESVDLNPDGLVGQVFAIGDGSNGVNRIWFTRRAASWQLYCEAAGVNSTIGVSDTIAVGDRTRFACRLATNDMRLAIAGKTAGVDTSQTLPAAAYRTLMRLGNRAHSTANDGSVWPGNLLELRIAPYAATDAEMDAYVGNS